jgi:hypothetical protein
VLLTPGPARDRQYLHAGLFVANHCHVLFALWDGREEIGTGGTAQIVRYYLGGPVPGARRATDNLRQMLAGDDDSLCCTSMCDATAKPRSRPRTASDNKRARLPRKRNHGGVVADPCGSESGEPTWRTSAGQRSFSAGLPPEYDRIFRRCRLRTRPPHAGRHANCPPRAATPPNAPGAKPMRSQVRYQRRTLWAMRAIHLLAVAMGLSLLLYPTWARPTRCYGCSWRCSRWAPRSPRPRTGRTGTASTSTTARSPKACACRPSGAARA